MLTKIQPSTFGTCKETQGVSGIHMHAGRSHLYKFIFDGYPVDDPLEADYEIGQDHREGKAVGVPCPNYVHNL